jgi:hypothetical protein
MVRRNTNIPVCLCTSVATHDLLCSLTFFGRHLSHHPLIDDRTTIYHTLEGTSNIQLQTIAKILQSDYA